MNAAEEFRRKAQRAKAQRIGHMIGVWTVGLVRLAFYVWVAYAVITMAMDVNHIFHAVDSRRYLDCVVVSADRLECKQVTVTDPPYQP